MKVQLYGGGIDSVCIAHLYKPDVKVWFHLGTEEADEEMAAARSAGCIIDHSLKIGQWVLPNKILPARNLLLVTLASYYGNEILIGSTAGDTTRDKDANFCSQASTTLDYILGHDADKAQPFHMNGVGVYAPAGKMTKTELVAHYLREGGNIDRLLASRSCYSAGEQECGECRSCIRKYVALRLNGISSVRLFRVAPDLVEAHAYALARGRGQETNEIRKLLDAQ